MKTTKAQSPPKVQRVKASKGWEAWRQGSDTWYISDNGYVVAELTLHTTATRKDDPTGRRKWKVIRRHEGTLTIRAASLAWVPKAEMDWVDYGPLHPAVLKAIQFCQDDSVWIHARLSLIDKAKVAGMDSYAISEALYKSNKLSHMMSAAQYHAFSLAVALGKHLGLEPTRA